MRALPAAADSRSIEPHPQGWLDKLIAWRECGHQVDASVVKETRYRRDRCLRSIDIDEQKMGLSAPGRCVGVSEALRHLLIDLACRTGDDISPTADLADLEVVFMTGEDKAHVGGVEERLERVPHFLIVLVVRSRRIDGMVGVRDQPAIRPPTES